MVNVNSNDYKGNDKKHNSKYSSQKLLRIYIFFMFYAVSLVDPLRKYLLLMKYSSLMYNKMYEWITYTDKTRILSFKSP